MPALRVWDIGSPNSRWRLRLDSPPHQPLDHFIRTVPSGLITPVPVKDRGGDDDVDGDFCGGTKDGQGLQQGWRWDGAEYDGSCDTGGE